MPSSDSEQSDLAALFGDENSSKKATLIPPPNFGMVDWGIYRSAYPSKDNLPFLKKLRLRSIVYLCMEPYLNKEFVEENKIKLFHFGIEGKTEPISEMPEDVIREALKVVLDVENYPLLIHCNRGKHRTGCLVGCYRKVQRWSLASVFEEYNLYAGAKARSRDLQFLERFDVSNLQRKGQIWKAISWWLHAFCDGHAMQKGLVHSVSENEQEEQQQQQQQIKRSSY